MRWERRRLAGMGPRIKPRGGGRRSKTKAPVPPLHSILCRSFTVSQPRAGCRRSEAVPPANSLQKQARRVKSGGFERGLKRIVKPAGYTARKPTVKKPLGLRDERFPAPPDDGRVEGAAGGPELGLFSRQLPARPAVVPPRPRGLGLGHGRVQ